MCLARVNLNLTSCAFSQVHHCSDKVVNQVLDELGIQFGEEMSKIPALAASVPAKAKSARTHSHTEAVTDADADLEARLQNLKRQ